MENNESNSDASKELKGAAKRKPPAAGIGRKKGTPNRITGDLKAMIMRALDKAGGEQYLLSQAHENPKAFLALIGRIIPLQVAGDPNNPVQTVMRVELVPMGSNEHGKS